MLSVRTEVSKYTEKILSIKTPCTALPGALLLSWVGGVAGSPLATTFVDPYFHHYFFQFSIATISHRRNTRIKNLLSESCSEHPKGLDPCQPFWGPLVAILHFVSKVIDCEAIFVSPLLQTLFEDYTPLGKGVYSSECNQGVAISQNLGRNRQK